MQPEVGGGSRGTSRITGLSGASSSLLRTSVFSLWLMLACEPPPPVQGPSFAYTQGLSLLL